MRKPVIVIGLSIVLILLVGAGVYSYFSPQLTLHAIRDAAEKQDTERLRDLVDFESVRAGLKEDIRTMVNASAAQDLRDNPFAMLGIALAGAIIDPMVDALVSPSAIVRAVSMGKIDGGAVQADKYPAGRAKTSAEKSKPSTSRRPGSLRQSQSRSMVHTAAILDIGLPSG